MNTIKNMGCLPTAVKNIPFLEEILIHHERESKRLCKSPIDFPSIEFKRNMGEVDLSCKDRIELIGNDSVDNMKIREHSIGTLYFLIKDLVLFARHSGGFYNWGIVFRDTEISQECFRIYMIPQVLKFLESHRDENDSQAFRYPSYSNLTFGFTKPYRSPLGESEMKSPMIVEQYCSGHGGHEGLESRILDHRWKFMKKLLDKWLPLSS